MAALVFFGVIAAHGQTSATPAATQTIDAEKAGDIRKLMKLDGTIKSLETAYPLMMRLLEGRFSKKAVAAAKKDLTLESLVERLIPVYAKYYSAEEIKSLLYFYQSPLGKKMGAVQQQLYSEKQDTARAWAADAGELVVKNMEFHDEKGSADKQQ